MSRVVIVGGSGFLGTGLRRILVAAGHRVTVIGRQPGGEHDGWTAVEWDACPLGPWTSSLDGADVVVHLAGKRVDCRPTRPNVDELIRSREATVRLAGEAIRRVDTPPVAWVQVTSLAIFGEGGEAVIDERTPVPSTGPRQMVEVCRRWEAAFEEASAPVARAVLLRGGIGIGGAGDPATRRLAQLARLGLAGPVAGGRQWVSWIGIDDLLDILVDAVTGTAMRGLYHLTGPTPVRNAELMEAYRTAVGRRIGIPSPRVATRLGAWMLGSDPALALTGRRCVPARLLTEGYQFRTADIHDAVRRAVGDKMS